MLVEPAHVAVAAQEPEQFVDDRFQVEFLGGDQRKPVGEIEAHLVAENAQGACAGAIGLRHAVVQRMLHQVEVLPHDGIISLDFEPSACARELTARGTRGDYRFIDAAMMIHAQPSDVTLPRMIATHACARPRTRGSLERFTSPTIPSTSAGIPSSGPRMSENTAR